MDLRKRKMKDWRKDIEHLAPCLDHERGCAHIIYAILSGSFILGIYALFFNGGLDWSKAPSDLLVYVGTYWIVNTVGYALFRRR